MHNADEIVPRANIYVPVSKFSEGNMIEKLYLQTHVTALCSIEPNLLIEGNDFCRRRVWFLKNVNINNFELTGCGGWINLYDFKSNELLESLDIFRGSRIHGLQYCAPIKKVVVFGGKLLAVVAVDDTATALSR